MIRKTVPCKWLYLATGHKIITGSYLEVLTIMVLLVACTAARSFAQEPDVAQSAGTSASCNLENYSTRRPGYGVRPTEVSVGIAVVDLVEIDDANQAVGLDLYIIMRWQDPALGPLVGCRVPYANIWNPELELINSGSLEFRHEPFVEIENGGYVRAATRVQGNISSPHNIANFPMDSRTIELNIFSLRNNIEDVVLVADDIWSTRAEDFTIGNWDVGDVSARVEPFEIPQLEQTFSRYTLELPAQRYAGYYFYKVMLPLGMIALMAFAVFWIDPRQFGAQLSLAATAVLTLVAFQFSLTDLLPTVSYLTRMDRFILGANVAVFAAMLESVLIGYLVTHNRQEAAIKIDTACRWVFPIAFIIFVIFVFY